VALLVYFFWPPHWTVWKLSGQRPRSFYGKVVDHNGSGIEAEIVIQQSKLVSGSWLQPSLAPERRPENRGSVYSGKNGNFLVYLQPDLNYLEIVDIKAPGYQWVTDWSWQVEQDIVATNSNKWFCLSGPRVAYPIYEPDANNVAVFPMYKIGDPSPSTRPSRGGFDRLRDKTLRTNRPTELGIPSAGPGTPVTPKEIEQAIRDYTEKRNADQLRQSQKETAKYLARRAQLEKDEREQRDRP